MDDGVLPLDTIDPSDQDRFQRNNHHAVFRRLREEDPVHFCNSERFGPFWSVTQYADILSVEKSHQVFSSDLDRGGITIKDDDFADILELGSSFITMDPPEHTRHRAMVAGAFDRENLARLEEEICSRVSAILDDCPVGDPFDWVEKVANELPIQVLALLFGIPQQDRHLLLRWSNLFVGTDDPDVVESRDAAKKELQGFVHYFLDLWDERASREPVNDLVSRLVHGADSRLMSRVDYLGTVVLLLIGGNDTTRNSISGGLWELMSNPTQYQKLIESPELVKPAVSEIIRWVSPVSHFRRTTVCDTQLGGKLIRSGEKVVMWYVSGNRDESVFEHADKFLVDRQGPRHLSFGAGVHHCIGWRLAEMQLTALWSEMLQRFPAIEPVSPPSRLWSNFINGIKDMKVLIPA